MEIICLRNTWQAGEVTGDISKKPPFRFWKYAFSKLQKIKNHWKVFLGAKRFLPETQKGVVKIIGDRIVSKGDEKIHDGELDLNSLDYAYVKTELNQQTYLFLRGARPISIPTYYSGFSDAYHILSKRFKFKDKIFFRHLSGKPGSKKEIWRKSHPKNYAIHNRGSKGLSEGFEIQSPEKEFISWDTTYSQLEKNKNALFKINEYGIRTLHFRFPVRLGNLVINDFSLTFNNGRNDVAILDFYAQCYDGSNGDRSYSELKQCLAKCILPDRKFYSDEREDSMHSTLSTKGMEYSLSYCYDSSWQYKTSYTALSISNRRGYPELLQNGNYEAEIEVSGHIFLKAVSGFLITTKQIHGSKNVLKKITELFQQQSICWIDNENKKIGFSSGEFAHIIDHDSVLQLSIENAIPAKSYGGSYLNIQMNTAKHLCTVLSADYKFFNKYADSLGKLLNKEL